MVDDRVKGDAEQQKEKAREMLGITDERAEELFEEDSE